MIRLVINGAAGRMGKELMKLLEDRDDFKVTATVDPFGRTSARTIAEVEAENCDGVIDFSQPAGTLRVAKWCMKHRKFLVSGTTGLTSAQQRSLHQSARKVPILWAPNLSLGVVAMKRTLNAFAGLEGFDFQVEEIHHRAKKDKPSGTALALQSELARTLGRRLEPPLAIRGGGVRGVHRVLAMGEGEMITIEHVAFDRAIFARGAIVAAKWLATQRRGYFSVEDLWPNKRLTKS